MTKEATDAGAMESNRVIIFDTTLRDGEQSPGASMNLDEKLRLADMLAGMGVDVIEAGFPIASPGDFEAVEAIARSVTGATICGLARAGPKTSNGRQTRCAQPSANASTRSFPPALCT